MTEFKVKAVLADIEGTTTSISFVKDVLFPYAKLNTFEYLTKNWNENETAGIVNRLVNLPQYKLEFLDTKKKVQTSVDAYQVADFVNFLIDKDVKVEPLKTLQGLVWQNGYANGLIKGHVYEDVPLKFRNWRENGIKVAIYSSGSIKAQKLLFGYSEVGDLTKFIDAYFDTTIGHKRQSESYKQISEKMSIDPEDIIFLTDIIEEAQAAHLAGMKTALLTRPDCKQVMMKKDV